MQAAIGVKQLDKLEGFIKKRKENWLKVDSIIRKFPDYFIPHIPTDNSDPSWFGYAITVKENSKFSRDDLVKHLNENRISTRLLFGGNLIKQPAYQNKKYRVVGSLDNADTVMKSTFWIGVYPGINEEMHNFIDDIFAEYIQNL